MKIKKQIFSAALLLSLTAYAHASADLPTESESNLYYTSSRIGNYEYELTGDLTVIESSALETSGVRNLPDALRQFAGVHIYDRSTPKTSVADIRGFGDAASSNVLVLVNGRRLNSVDLSGPDLIQIPIEAVERIEVLRGAGSVLYGDNAVGGVIHVITKKGGGDLHGQASYQYGSYDRHKTAGQVSGELGLLGYFAYASYDDDKGYRDRSDVLARNFNGRLTVNEDGPLRADLELGHHRDQTELPGGLDEAELVGFGRRGAADNSFSETEDTFGRLSLEADLGDDGGRFGRIVIDGILKEREVDDSFFRTFNSERNIDQWGLLMKYVFDRELFGKDIDFVLGVDIYETDNDILGSGTNTDDITIEKDEVGMYLFLETETAENLYVNAGGRYQSAEYAFDDRGNQLITSQDPDEWAGLFGMRWNYSGHSNIYFNIQKVFRFLATDEWYSTFSGLNTSLTQQSGRQYEFGIKHEFSDAAQISVTPYLLELDDEIYYDPSTFSNANYEKTRRRGVESILTLELDEMLQEPHINQLDLRFGHTYQDPEFKDGLNNGSIIPLVPSHQFTHQVILRMFDHWLFNVHGRLIGERVIGNDLDNSKSKADSYYVLDATVSYRNGPHEIFVEINNMLDEDYNTYEIEKTSFANPSITRDVYPAQKRNANVGYRLRF